MGARVSRRTAIELCVLLSGAVAGCGGGSGNVTPGVESAGRVVALGAPQDAASGRRAGCVSQGKNVGSGFGNLIEVSGGLDQHLRPGDGGAIRVVLLATARSLGTAPARSFDLKFFRGAQGSDGTFVPADGDRAREAWGVSFEHAALAEDGWMETREATFVMPVPVFTDYLTQLDVSAASFTGKVTIDDRGLKVENGALTGYVTAASVQKMLVESDKVCLSPRPPEICAIVRDFLGPDKNLSDALPTLLSFAGGYDTRVENGRASTCDPKAEPTDCNAVSACILVGIEPVKIARGGAAAKR